MKKVIFILSSWDKMGDTGEKTGWWMSEAAHPWKKLNDAGIVVDFASPQGGEPPVTGVDMQDPINIEFMQNPTVQDKLKHTYKPAEIKKEDYAAIHFVGGHGACWDFPDNKELQELTAWFYENDRIVSAVCHGPSGLFNVKLSNGEYLIKDKRLTAFSDMEECEIRKCYDVPFLLQEELMLKGCRYILTPNWSDHVEVDGRLITGQNPQSALSLGAKLAEMILK